MKSKTMPSKISCAACENKEISGIFKCEGCSQTFCLKHTNEHRYLLDFQLEEIILEHENMFNTFNENKPDPSYLFDQVNQWEKNAIVKVQQAAKDARLEIQRLAEEEKEHTKEKFYEITKQLENAREYHEYLEKDLSRWKLLLEQIKYDLNNISSPMILQQDQDDLLIPKLFISKVNKQALLNETLVSYSDAIQFDEQHHMAMHCGPCRNPAYITGSEEYASGQHQIRLFISKKTSEFVLSFNIMSKLMELSDHSEFLTYGWQSDDCVNPSQYCLLNEKIIHDLKGKTKFHINLLIDCDQHTISYFNEKTRRKREIMVDVNKCPLPWKLYFYLYDVGDTVRLLSSSHLS